MKIALIIYRPLILHYSSFTLSSTRVSSLHIESIIVVYLYFLYIFLTYVNKLQDIRLALPDLINENTEKCDGNSLGLGVA